MRSLKLSLQCIIYLLLCVFVPACGVPKATNSKSKDLKDRRDGNVYKTVRIGKQVWMAENLGYSTSDSHLNSQNPSEKYGRLYTWEESLEVCPVGWHLPTETDWRQLVTELRGENGNGNKLKSTSGWKNEGSGSDMFGFEAYPAGCFNSFGKTFSSLDERSYFWSATEKDSSGNAWSRCLLYDSKDIHRYFMPKINGLSVRCVKD